MEFFIKNIKAFPKMAYRFPKIIEPNSKANEIEKKKKHQNF